MEALEISIPRRLKYLRIVVTIGLFISFLLCFNLWGGQRFFPAIPVIKNFILMPPYDYALIILSLIFLLCSLILKPTRSFIFLALIVNCVLVLFDLNRLQPWFYIYNVILIIFLFYDGRVDNPNRFTSFFIYIQLIVASVYVFNGLSQLINPYFIITDFRDAILPLEKIVSDRQFAFFLKLGKGVPFLFLFIGFGLLVKPVKYLAISLGIGLHFLLIILLFPSVNNSNYALWFMNIVFAFMMVFLFSGKTQQRYFSLTVLFQRPLFYIVLITFWMMPMLNYSKRWPSALSSNFKSGNSDKENIKISENTFKALPLYVKSFCNRNDNYYVLKVSSWCRHELHSEYFNQSVFVDLALKDALLITDLEGETPGDELSVK